MATIKRIIASNNNFFGTNAKITSAAILKGFNNNPRIISWQSLLCI